MWTQVESFDENVSAKEKMPYIDSSKFMSQHLPTCRGHNEQMLIGIGIYTHYFTTSKIKFYVNYVQFRSLKKGNIQFVALLGVNFCQCKATLDAAYNE